MKTKRAATSRTVWAIRTRQGRISTDRRRLGTHGIQNKTGLHGSHVFERAMQAGALTEQARSVYVGPLWLKKEDAEPFLWQHERVVRVRLVEVNDAK